MRLNQVTLPALDVAASVSFYRRMGFPILVDDVHYARFQSIDDDTTFSVHLVEALPVASPTVVYFETERLDAVVRELQSRGFVFEQEPRDEPWLWREARLLDPAGNVICLFWAGKNRLDPPWRVRE